MTDFICETFYQSCGRLMSGESNFEICGIFMMQGEVVTFWLSAYLHSMNANGDQLHHIIID